MNFTLHHRTLLRACVTSAVLLGGVSACSRSDRDEGSSQNQSGAAVGTSDTTAIAGTGSNAAPAGATQTQPADTAVSQANAPSERQPVAQATPAAKPRPTTSSSAADTGVSGYQAMTGDTTATADTATETAGAAADSATEMAGAAPTDTGRSSTDTVVVGDSAQMGKTGERLEPTVSSEQANADTLAGQPESDRVRPPEDSSETMGAVNTSDSTVTDTGAMADDSSVTASAEMARDTTNTLAQADTSVQVQVDTTSQTADTAATTAADTGVAVQAQIDTTTADQQTGVVAQGESDSAVVVGDSTEMGKTGERLEPNQASAQANADTVAHEDGRIRPPEDSTEVLGNVTTEEDRAQQEQSEVSPDQAPAAAAGAQVSGETVTGAEAVAQITREGQRCAVMQSEESEKDIRWDLASSPATMNPCGTGTMTLPRIQTEK